MQPSSRLAASRRLPLIFVLPGQRPPFFLPRGDGRRDFNPMVGVIEGFRWAVSSGRSAFPQQSLLLSLVTITILLVTGIWYFRKTERTFADVI